MPDKCNCVNCRDNKMFEMPQQLYDALLSNNLVIFACSGVSTEKRNVYPYSFYHEICELAKINPKTCKLAFPEVMSRYESQPNGRTKLVLKIKERIDYINSFWQLKNTATQFHRELSKIHQITEIFTTNWDDFFEKECAAIPFVYPEDFIFYNLPQRKVYKIHGSINNLSTIVASNSDYRRCYNELRRNQIGAYLKHTLTTKTIVFCGYSFQDYDFNKIYNYIKRTMGRFLPHSYIVTLDEKIDKKIDQSKITPIITDATYFIHCLYNKLVEDKVINNSEIYSVVATIYEYITEIHSEVMNRFNIFENFNVFYTYSYQDGLIDALTRAMVKRDEGKYLFPVYISDQINTYKRIRKDKIRTGRYYDVAYIDGYINGLLLFLAPKKIIKELPVYYIYGYKDIHNLREYEKIIRSKRIMHKHAYEYAKKYMTKYGRGIVPQHTAFLL